MSSITGPRIQMPAVQSPFGMNPQGEPVSISVDWASFFHSVQQTVFNLTRSGPTASRPTSTVEGRYVGMDFFDTTLGYKITLKSVSPDVWVDGTGTPV